MLFLIWKPASPAFEVSLFCSCDRISHIFYLLELRGKEGGEQIFVLISSKNWKNSSVCDKDSPEYVMCVIVNFIRPRWVFWINFVYNSCELVFSFNFCAYLWYCVLIWRPDCPLPRLDRVVLTLDFLWPLISRLMSIIQKSKITGELGGKFYHEISHDLLLLAAAASTWVLPWYMNSRKSAKDQGK